MSKQYIDKLTRLYEKLLKENYYNSGMKTDLIAHGEHIADDLASFAHDNQINLTDDQISKLTEFVQTYMNVTMKRMSENPKWFKTK